MYIAHHIQISKIWDTQQQQYSTLQARLRLNFKKKKKKHCVQWKSFSQLFFSICMHVEYEQSEANLILWWYLHKIFEIFVSYDSEKVKEIVVFLKNMLKISLTRMYYARAFTIIFARARENICIYVNKVAAGFETFAISLLLLLSLSHSFSNLYSYSRMRFQPENMYHFRFINFIRISCIQYASISFDGRAKLWYTAIILIQD